MQEYNRFCMFRYLINQILVYFYLHSPNRRLIEEDLDHWKEIFHWTDDYVTTIKRLFVDKPEYRNLFYYRIGGKRVFSQLFYFFYPPLPTLYIWSQHIGGGLFIQHGFATVIAADRIGRHCFINQQVTIGYKGDYAPVLGDNVVVTCGAKVLGNISVGNNVVIGANAVVVKDVPNDVTVVGVPAHILKGRCES